MHNKVMSPLYGLLIMIIVTFYIQFLSPAIESAKEDSSSLVAELQEKLQEEKAKFLEQLEEQEKRKNEEMQNVRTSLIAEQQVFIMLLSFIFILGLKVNLIFLRSLLCLIYAFFHDLSIY